MVDFGEIIKKKSPTLGPGVMVGLGVGLGLALQPITTQYFIAYNGFTTPIDYWLQHAERLIWRQQT
jgi:hypothetical protein